MPVADPAAAADSALASRVAQIETRLARVEQRLSPSPLRREDHAALQRILPAIAGALGSECFLSSEIVASDNPALVLVLADMNARRLGRLLRRGDGVEVEGYMVRASGTEAGAVLWCVYRVR